MTPAPTLPFPSASAPASVSVSATIKPSAKDVGSNTAVVANDNDGRPRDFNAVFSKCAPKNKSEKSASKSETESSGSDASSSSSESSDSSDSSVTEPTASGVAGLVGEPVVLSPMALWALRFNKEYSGQEPAATATTKDVAPDSSVKANVTTATLGCVTPSVPNPNSPAQFNPQAAPQAVSTVSAGTTANVTVATNANTVSSFQPHARSESAQIFSDVRPTPFESPAATPSAADYHVSTASIAANAVAAASPEAVVVTAPSMLSQPQEKLAATSVGVPAATSGESVSASASEFLNVEKQQLVKPAADVGTEVAKPSNTMASRSDKFAVEPRTLEVAARVAHSSDAVSAVCFPKRSTSTSGNNTGSDSSQSDSNNFANTGTDSAFASDDTANTAEAADASATSSNALSVPTAVASAVTPAHSSSLASAAVSVPGSAHASASAERLHEVVGRASDAAGAVREVVDMTHEFRARERGSVEVKFNFKDDTELSVRIAVKAGEVQTTFRTDSAELRATLGREWLQQLAANSSEAARTARLVDPVFMSNASGQGSTSANGGDAQRQSFSQHEQSASNRGESFANFFNSTGPRGGSTTSARPAVSHRPETVRHLHAFA